MEEPPPTVVVALTEKLQKSEEIRSELIILQNLGTWGQNVRLTVSLGVTKVREPSYKCQ